MRDVSSNLTLPLPCLRYKYQYFYTGVYIIQQGFNFYNNLIFYKYTMNITLILFLIGILGFVLNRKNIILMLISIEVMLLSITFLILVSSLNIDDIVGQTYAIYIIAVAGAESAIGLGILVAFYRLNFSLITACLSLSLKTYSKKEINFSSHSSSIFFFLKKIRARSYSTKAFNENVNISVLGVKGSTLVSLCITGLLLSDDLISLSSKYSKKARIGFKQSADRASYVWFVYNLLSHYCGSSPQFTAGVRSGKRYYGLQFFTRAMPYITELYYLFYSEGVKSIPHNIYELLTPIAFAEWITGDGVAKKTGLVLCTDSYSIKDTVRLLNVLIIRSKLNCILRVAKKDQYRIYIQQNYMASLVNIVSPYKHYTMLYKVKSWFNTPRDRSEIEVFDVKNNITTAYSSINEVARILNIPLSAVVSYFSRNQVKPYKSRYTFKKV